MQFIQKSWRSATNRGWLASLLFVIVGAVCGTQTASAFLMVQSFDGTPNATVARTLAGYDSVNSSSIYVTTNFIFDTSSYSLTSNSTGASNYLYIPVGNTAVGQFTIDMLHTSTAPSQYVQLQDINSGGQFGFGYTAGGVQLYNDNNVVATIIPSASLASNVWYKSKLEYREGSTFMEYKVTFNGIQSQWIVSTVPNTGVNWRFTHRMVRSSGNTIFAENLFVITDNDMSSVSTSTSPTFSSVGQQLNTAFVGLLTTGSTTANNVRFEAQYFIDSREVDTQNSLRNPLTVDFKISRRNTNEIDGRGISVNGVYGSSSSIAIFKNLTDGTYDLFVAFGNPATLFGEKRPFENVYLYSSFTMTNGRLSNVGVLEKYNTSYSSFKEILECNALKIGNCIINAFSYLFVPSTESTLKFGQTFETLRTKAPFVYFYQVQASITSIWAHPSALPTISIPFGDVGSITLLSAGLLSSVPFMPTIRLILGSLIWLMLAMTVYKRTLKIFDNTTTV